MTKYKKKTTAQDLSFFFHAATYRADELDERGPFNMSMVISTARKGSVEQYEAVIEWNYYSGCISLLSLRRAPVWALWRHDIIQ